MTMASHFFIDTRSRRYYAFTAYEVLTSPALLITFLSGATTAALLAPFPPLLGVALISGGGSLLLLLLFFFATTYLPSLQDPAPGLSLTNRSSFALLKILRQSGAARSAGAPVANVAQNIFNSPPGRRALLRLQLRPETVLSHLVSSAAHLSAQAIGERSSALAQSQQSPRLEIEHLLGAVLLQPVWQTLLREADLQEDDIIFMVWWLLSARQANEAKRAWWRRDRILSASGIGLGFAAGFTPLVDRLSRIPQGNLWDMFSEGQSQLVEQLTLTLARMRQSNVLLVGQPGVGRLGVIQSLARRIRTHHSHPALNGQRVVYLHIGALLAQGTSTASQLAIISNVLTEIERAGNIIAVIDGLSSILADNEPRLDLTEILLPFFSSLAVRVIVIISSDEYHLRLATNEELVHFFEVLPVPPASPAATLRSLARATPLIERTQGVSITYPALAACVQGTSGILQHIPYPERAFDVLEEAVVAASTHPDRVVTADLVEQLITNKVGIPFTKLKRKEKKYLLELENTMHQRLVNQNQAVAALARAMIRARSGVRNTEKPIGSFLFLGPTGVGKTEAAKTLAATYFGSEQYLSRLDMSEFGRPASVASLIGSHTQPVGRLTSLITDKPFTVLLLDEFEKAHRHVQQLFLQVFDEGRLTDARGYTVSFQHAIIIATSNAGADFIRAEAKDGLLPTGFTNTLQDHLMTQGIFTPELMNRFDGVITFAPLNPEHLRQIARLMLVKLNTRLDEQHGVTVSITPELIDYLTSIGYSPEFGARPLARAIQDTVEYEVAKRVLAGLAQPGEVIILSLSRLNAERQR